MKKVIVTGGAGFIGSNLVKYLLKKKYFVINIDKLSYSANPYNTKNLNKRINIREANIYLKKIITNYYTPEIHNSSLDLPLWIKKLSEFN